MKHKVPTFINQQEYGRWKANNSLTGSAIEILTVIAIAILAADIHRSVGITRVAGAVSLAPYFGSTMLMDLVLAGVGQVWVAKALKR